MRLGEYDTRTDPDCVEQSGQRKCGTPVQDFRVSPSDIIVHPRYNVTDNDIALIKLNRDATFTGKFDFVPFSRDSNIGSVTRRFRFRCADMFTGGSILHRPKVEKVHGGRMGDHRLR